MLKFKHSKDPDSLFNLKQLKMGIAEEHEHTNSSKIAKAIAKAHLIEDPAYYTHLSAMMKKYKK